MALEIQPGGDVRITIQKTVTRDAARKTLERLFMKDKSVAAPIESRSANFKELPKRRGGCIWTKRLNKVHLSLDRGAIAGGDDVSAGVAHQAAHRQARGRIVFND